MPCCSHTPPLFSPLTTLSTPANPKPTAGPFTSPRDEWSCFPKGSTRRPEGYQGSIGPRPALIKIEGKVVGEVYAAQLKGAPAAEAKGMAASAGDNENIKLVETATIKYDDQDVEVVRIRFNLPSIVGSPWVLHSLYFPRGEASSTFKLVVSEAEVATALPYFEAMVFPLRDQQTKD